MKTEALEPYTKEILQKVGWHLDRKHDTKTWTDILAKEGYRINANARAILRELGDLQFRISSNGEHCGVTMHFDPVNAASGEYDRMEDFVAAAGEEMYPLGELYDGIMYAGESGRIYVGDWKTLHLAGDSIEEFLNNMFNPDAHITLLWTSDGYVRGRG